MLAMTLNDIRQALPAAEIAGVLPNKQVSSVVIDSRDVGEGSLFIAIKGNRVDGHDFLNAVEEQGAVAAIVERFVEAGLPQIKVADSVESIGILARAMRDNYSGVVISMTGSCGKTSTKEMLAGILSINNNITVTSGNRNNEIGVPLSVFSISEEHDFAVIEMGAAEKGDIAYLMQVADADITTITNIRSAHIGRFGSLQALLETKSEIFTSLKDDGKALINADEEYVEYWQEILKGKTVCLYSINKSNADIYASDIVLGQTESRFTLHVAGQEISVKLHVAGEHNVSNALCAAGLAHLAGIDLQTIRLGLESYQGISSRMELKQGSWGGMIIDDTYNANLASFKAAIDVLVTYSGDTFLVMGDMAELGEYSEELHREVGEYACDKGVNHLLTYGPLSEYAAKAFHGAKTFNDKNDIVRYLEPMLKEKDTVLVKGSRSAGMEDIVDLLSGEGKR